MRNFKYRLYTLIFGVSLHEDRKLYEQLKNNVGCFEVGQNYIRIVNSSYGVQELKAEAEELSKIYLGGCQHE